MRSALSAIVVLGLAVTASIGAMGCSSEEDANADADDGDGDADADADADVDADGDGDGEGDVDDDTDADGDELPDATDHDRLSQRLEDLSSDTMGGRLTGTESGERAEQYITEALAELGLEVQTQEVAFPVSDLASPVDLAVVDGSNEPVTTLTYIDQYREVLFSGSGSVSGELWFVGHGAEADYEGLDVTGQIVAMLMADNAVSQFQRAYDKGAAGVVFLPHGLHVDYEGYMGDAYQPYLMQLGGDIESGDLREDLPALFVRTSAVAALLGKTLSELEDDSTPYDAGIRVHLELHQAANPEATCRNILVTIPGKDPTHSGEVIALGAHYDHIGRGADGIPFNGASDNASGPAAVLEIVQSLTGTTPARTLLFAFWCAEEQGIFGSTSYVTEPVHPLESTLLYVNLDNVAESDRVYYLTADSGVPVVEQFHVASQGIAEPLPDISLAFQCASDECPFHLSSVPFVRYLGMGNLGHTRNDTFENARVDILERVADATLLGVEATAYSPE
jgi:hypothetical protein